MRVKIKLLLQKNKQGKFLSTPQTISLNGRRYDALTGKLLKDKEDRSNNSHPSQRLSYVKHPIHRKTVDGFVKGTSNRKSITTQKLSTTQSKKNHKVAPHINRATQHSKTLMRTAVKNPRISNFKDHQFIATNQINNAVSLGMSAAAPATKAIANRARAIKRSDFVGRVSEFTTPANPTKPDPNIIQTSANSEVHLKNLDQLAQIEANPNLDEIFSEASLKLADSHQPIERHEDRFYDILADKLRISVKMLFIISLVLFVVIFSSITGIIFKNNISIYAADTRTGIHGILPTYIPAGFGINKIDYATGSPTGTITINYKDGSGNKTYNIIEQSTTWDSQALVSSVVQPDVGNVFKSYQVGGRSVFMFNNTAVWVESGIYYRLNNNAQLTPNQINRIVNTT